MNDNNINSSSCHSSSLELYEGSTENMPTKDVIASIYVAPDPPDLNSFYDEISIFNNAAEYFAERSASLGNIMQNSFHLAEEEDEVFNSNNNKKNNNSNSSMHVNLNNSLISLPQSKQQRQASKNRKTLSLRNLQQSPNELYKFFQHSCKSNLDVATVSNADTMTPSGTNCNCSVANGINTAMTTDAKTNFTIAKDSLEFTDDDDDVDDENYSVNSNADNDESRYDDVTHGSSFDDDCFILNTPKTARNE